MQQRARAIPVFVASIALYFVVYFGIEAARILTSPVYGLDQPGFAHAVHGIGHRLTLGPEGLMRVAVFLGVLKLSVAVAFAAALVNRLSAVRGRTVEHEIVDAAAVLVVIVTVLAATPALFDGETGLLAQYRLPLWLSGLAVTLSMIERAVADEAARAARMPRRVQVYDVRLPPRRNGVSTLRWDALRRSVNVNAG